MPLRIMLADDNHRLRGQLRNLVESRPGWQVVAEAVNGRDAVQKAAELLPDVLVIDYYMPELDGISAIPEIRRAAPQAEIVVLTVDNARFTVARAVNAGARGYVAKSEIVKDLMPAIEAASEHKLYLSFLDAVDDRSPSHAPPKASKL